MNSNWQTWAALGIVAITVVGFIVRAVRRHHASKNGCPNAVDCGCAGAKLGESFRAQHGHK